MKDDPDAIRQDIEETRERMSERVDAIGQKADVKERVSEAVAERRAAMADTAATAADQATALVVRRRRPIGIAAAAVAAVGFVAGVVYLRLRPRSSRWARWRSR
jgi:hypothetical protein